MDERQQQAQMINEFIKKRQEDQLEKERQFLEVLSMIESSGGKNFDHQMLTSGIHKGHKAAGRYGLMPNTMQEIYTRSKRDGLDTSMMEPAMKMDPAAMKKYVEENPELEQDFASKLAQHVLDRQGGNEEKAAYSWFQGHNLSPDRIDQMGYEDHDYVEKYRKYKDQLFGDKGE